MADDGRVRRWLGRTWRERTYECGEFARDVLLEEFGVRARWPTPAGDPREKQRQVTRFRASGLMRRIRKPREGDVLLMRDKRGRRLAGWHVGVMIDGAVLHLPADGTSLHQPLHRLLEDGWEIEGWYRCR